MTSANDHISPFQHARSLVHGFACKKPSQPGTWRITEDQPTGMLLATIRDAPFRLVRFDSLGSGFLLGTLGANYQRICGENTVGLHPLMAGVLERESTKAKCFLLCFHCRDDSPQPIPLATLLEDTHGDYHLIDVAPNRDARFWAILTIAMHIMVERPADPTRFDTHGDYLTLGAPSIVQRHGTERLRRSLAKRVRYDRRLCLDCLQCATQCNEMRSLVTGEGATLLGPSDDFCTNCGMCQRRCTYLVAEPRQAGPGDEPASLPITDGGAGFHLHDGSAEEYLRFIAVATDQKPQWWPYSVANEWLLPSVNSDFPVRRQIRLSAGWDSKPMQITTIRDDFSGDSVLIRSHYRALVLLQSEAGAIEEDLISGALRLGLDVTCAAEPRSSGAIPKPNRATKLCGRLGRHVTIGHSALSLWQNREADLILAPFADRLNPELHQVVLGETGRLSQILSPNILQALPVTRSPVLGQLTRQLADIFARYPELREAEADLARLLLSNIPANHARIHGRYGPMAFSSGHSACPSCVEAQVLAIPVYMGIAMSLARGEMPQVYFTCETGCMSETLNKVNEVAQRVPGGRTVFGGGFAFGEASAMAQDRAIRCGLLPKGRRYVVSQGGDGGAAIGLPAWLNALRQQAYLIRGRHPNVLHFITITDTQVYSNTGGESSVSSMLGMDTLTTPIGKILSGNQRIQWNLINLAAEFPNILVAAGHSANRVAIQRFWQLADQLGQSAMRWDITPCPETGKFFGDDPDDLAEIMAHAGMIPEILFCGRFRKRVAPYHPEDRGKPYNEWNRRPKPITYWLHRDPRYKTLFRKNAETGSLEPVNLTAHFLITQLESCRDQLNWQIDLETHFVNQAEQWVSSFLHELAQSWKQYRYRLEQFRYAMLFNSKGELKPEVAATLEREMALRVLGWDELTRYTTKRERFLHAQPARFDNLIAELERLEELTAGHSTSVGVIPGDDRRLMEITRTIQSLNQSMQRELKSLSDHLNLREVADPLEQELFPVDTLQPPTLPEERRKDLYRLLDRILEERALAMFTELQQHRLARQLHGDFLDSGGIIKEVVAAAADPARNELLRQIAGIGPFSIGVASLAGDRGIAVNRIFANFFTLKGAWAGMAWQFGSSKRGTPVLSATFVDARPIQRKDAMQSLPVAVLTVTNYEEMKRQPDMFFGQLMPTGFLIINHRRDPEELWQELVRFYPQEVRDIAVALRTKYRAGIAASPQSRQKAAAPSMADREACSPIAQNERLILVRSLMEEISESLYGKPSGLLTKNERQMVEKLTAMVTVRLITLDMDGIMHQATGSTKILSNLVAVAPMHYALRQLGLPFDWDRDLPFLLKGFPGAVLKNPQLLDAYCRAMAIAIDRISQADDPTASRQGTPGEAGKAAPPALGPSAYADNPDKYLMIMGGTLAGMVLSQIATAESPLFYVGFPITPAGNPFYAMAEAYANGHPYIVVDENNPSEKVAAEKLLGIARTGGFLPVTFTASQGWRLFTEVIPQFVGARLEGLFLLAKRALAAPNLNIEESHTDFMSFRDDGGIMLAPKGIQEYVPALYLARLLTHFAKLPVILSIGGITDTHKITLVKAPADDRVRSWLQKTLKDFDFWEHKLINRQGELIVHGPSGTSAVYQETQSELEKAHLAVRRVLPYALKAVEELTGARLDELEVRSRTPKDRVKTLLILQGSLFPNAVEALEELESQGWTGMACVSVRFFNPFPEQALSEWLECAERVIVMDRSNSFGSIPPLASRVLGTMARLQATQGPARKNPIRILVGGLGGREITVAEMKEVLLSSHLLFHPCEDWEKPWIEELLGKDAHLHVLLEEAAACDLRNTDRHTRVPPGLRTDDLRHGEFQDCLDTLKGLLANKQYVSFLANHCQVEFLGVREVLQESALLLEIVKRLEIQLAGRAVRESRFSWRQLLILLLYGRADEDRKKALDLLAGFADLDLISPKLKASFGIAGELGSEKLLSLDESENPPPLMEPSNPPPP